MSARKNAKQDLEAKLAALRADLKAAQAAGGDIADAALERSAELAAQALQLAEETLEAAADETLQAATSAVSATGDALDDARDMVRNRPIGAMFIAAGIGAVLSCLLFGRRSED